MGRVLGTNPAAPRGRDKHDQPRSEHSPGIRREEGPPDGVLFGHCLGSLPRTGCRAEAQPPQHSIPHGRSVPRRLHRSRRQPRDPDAQPRPPGRPGRRFRRAYSSVPSCTPARATILTGLSPWHHGMLGYGAVARRYPREMPQLLRDAGYYTLGIGKMHYAPQRDMHGFLKTILDESGRSESPGFVSDYRQWFKSAAPGLNPDATGIGWNDHRAKPYALPEELHPTRWTGDEVVKFLSNYDGPAPFFLKVSFARPHSPYDPPLRWWNRYAEAALPPAVVGDWAERHARRGKPYPNDLWQGDLGPEKVRAARQGYYGSVSFVDEQIGRILAVLEQRGWLEHTLILFTVGPRRHAGGPQPLAKNVPVPILGTDPDDRALAGEPRGGPARPGARSARRAARRPSHVPGRRRGALSTRLVRRPQHVGAGPRPERIVAEVDRPGARHLLCPGELLVGAHRRPDEVRVLCPGWAAAVVRSGEGPGRDPRFGPAGRAPRAAARRGAGAWSTTWPSGASRS